MKSTEDKIKDFARGLGIECIGIAGPERLQPPPASPPSLDPTFIMSGAKSIISFALPMDVDAIDEYLSKKSPTPHNIDQKRKVQDAFWHAKRIQDYIISLGYRAKMVRTNSDYRRMPNPLATHPSFSHRFGAVAAGIAAHGWSGNVMTKEYGAAIYQSTVVTDAVLKSDPALDPRYFLDGFCSKCKLCAKSCTVKMFHEDEEEEYVLLNDEPHPRAKRYNIDLCNTACFGLHGLSSDKKWSTWGRYWIKDWVGKDFGYTQKKKIFKDMLVQGVVTGTAFRRYEVIRKMASILRPESVYRSLPDQANMPVDEEDRVRVQKEYCVDELKVKTLDDYNVSTCANCSLICGPDLTETARRYRLLTESGIVVPGPGGKMTRVDTYEEAVAMKEKYPDRLRISEKLLDAFMLMFQFPFFYMGFNPKSSWQGFIYNRALQKSRKQTKAARKREQRISDQETIIKVSE